MSFSLHEHCIESLNHPISQALACGKSLPNIQAKTLSLKFGLIHLFVVSGAHINFINTSLQSLKAPLFLKNLICLSFTAACDFNAPVTRAFLQHLIQRQSYTRCHLPNFTPLIASFFIYLPVSFFKENTFSLCLSFLFSAIIQNTPKNKMFSIFFYAFSFPLFSSFLGHPHISFLFISLLATPIIGFLLLPLSLAGLLSNTAEFFCVQIWWLSSDALIYLDTFFNHPEPPKINFKNSYVLYLYSFGYLALYTMRFKWKRNFLFSF